MWKWILGLIIIVAMIEFYVFDFVIGRFGGMNTFLLTLFTSAVGLVMMRFEGRKVLEDARSQMQNRQIPGRTLVDGLSIFIGGLFLVLPGFFTDVVGFTMIFPLTRPIYRLFILRWLKKKMKNGNMTVYRR
ncbi:FxsA family protein [Paenibacillus glacialis]|uniref:Exlusion protein FxsA n=1 Tax=Paenibacillus glacialis TaxID=494026 RepID=A0A162K5D7_9BACL|nr:FxsA family protein [Paenibacillus glacialis]OAB43256.1 exlusion protein FxsA [Paenibacillus glacialis]